MAESISMKIYYDPVFTELVRAVGYRGCQVRDLGGIIQDVAKRTGKDKRVVESASWHLVTFDGQMTCNPSPLAKVELRAEVRRLSRSLLGPPPEAWDEFYRHPDGTPDQFHAAKMEELARHYPHLVKKPAKGGTKPQPKASEPRPVLTPEEQRLRKLNKRQLACMLRDARKSLAHNGKRSHSGKLARQEIEKAEAEYRRRGLPIPELGEETAEWDKLADREEDDNADEKMSA